MAKMIEEWRDVVGYEALYQVSNLGRVKSLARFIKNRWGGLTFHKERMLTPVRGSYGYWRVCIHNKDGEHKSPHIHKLVLDAFVGKPIKTPNGERIEASHLNGNKDDKFTDQS